MSDYLGEVVEALGLQNQMVRKIDLHFEVNCIPTAEVEILFIKNDELVTVFKHYRLEEIVQQNID